MATVSQLTLEQLLALHPWAAEYRGSKKIERLWVYFGIVPRGALGAAAIRIGFPTIKRAYDRVLPALAAQLDRLRPEVLQLPAPALSEAAETRLRAGREQLMAEALPGEAVDRLVDLIRTGDDADLHRIQIFGGTVNIAAKLQALAEGYQIAMSDATYRSTGVAELLAEQQADVEDLTYESKALRDVVRVKRWTVYRDR